MIGPRNIHPDELGEAEGMEVQDALRVGNRLVEAMDDVPMPAGEGFVDNVMAALADEPTPGATGFLVPLRRRGILGGFRDSFRQAWTSVGAGRPIVGRSAALAYVLAVAVAGVSLTGAAALGTAGALGLFNATPTQSPAPPTVAPSPTENAPEPTMAPSPSPTPTETDDETDDPNDDNSGPGGGGDDDSGRGDDGDSSGPGGNSGPGENSGPGSSGSGKDDSGPGSGNSGPG
jgi:uncharacterized membrane protein YgcG